MRKVTMQVTINAPDDCSAEQIRFYVREAISSWSGQFDPEDSLFGHFHGEPPNYTPRNLRIRFVRSK